MVPRFYEQGYGDPPTWNSFNGGDNNSMYQGYDIDSTRIDWPRTRARQ